jgi:protein tyrosine/serine phosphatase
MDVVSPMANLWRYVFSTLLALLIVAGPLAYYRYQTKASRNLRVVKDGFLYRSGQFTPQGLAGITKQLGIRTVVSLRVHDGSKRDSEPSYWEDVVCKELGIKFVRIPLGESPSVSHPHLPTPSTIAQFREVLTNDQSYPKPVLLHCCAGIHRAGMFTALYRMEFEGWTPERAMEEMRECGFEGLENMDDVQSLLRSRYRSVHGAD